MIQKYGKPVRLFIGIGIGVFLLSYASSVIGLGIGSLSGQPGRQKSAGKSSAVAGDGKKGSGTASGSVVGYDFGVAFGDLYKGQRFMPHIRDLNTALTKVYIFWNQIEPSKGQYRWTIIDSFVSQLNESDEALVAIWASSKWASSCARKNYIRGSKPTDMKAYYAFIYNLVKRCRGKVKYFQNDCEPNSVSFWCGTKEEFVDTLKVFYRAVKDADLNAVVIVGGHDGGFSWGNPNNQGFFDHVFEKAHAYFDVFDVRLYGDIYDIPHRVDWFRNRMAHYGFSKPIVCTEYGGPIPTQFKESQPFKKKFRALLAQGHSKKEAADKVLASIEGMRKKGQRIPQVDMFLASTTKELEDRRDRIHCRDITQRTVMALSCGVQRLWLWDLINGWGESNQRLHPVFGKLRLMTYDLSERLPAYYCYQRMAEKLKTPEGVWRVDVGNDRVHLFRVDKTDGRHLFVVWEKRDYFAGEDRPPTAFRYQVGSERARVTDVFGHEETKTCINGTVSLELRDTPLFFEPMGQK